MTASEYIETIHAGKSCCADSGFCRKIHKHFRRLTDNDRRLKGMDSLRLVLDVGGRLVCSKGGTQSTKIETLFSICRMLGLRHFIT